MRIWVSLIYFYFFFGVKSRTLIKILFLKVVVTFMITAKSKVKLRKKMNGFCLILLHSGTPNYFVEQIQSKLFNKIYRCVFVVDTLITVTKITLKTCLF